MIPTSLGFMRERRDHDCESTPWRVPKILNVLDKCPIYFFYHICLSLSIWDQRILGPQLGFASNLVLPVLYNLCMIFFLIDEETSIWNSDAND